MKNITLSTILFTLITFICSCVNAQVQPTSSVIKFTKFDVVEQNSKIAINIETDGTVQTNYFEIQKSNDGVNFKTIALILGPDPKQTTCDCYGCFDKLLIGNTKAYYRAKHISSDGVEQVSSPKSLAKS